MRFGRFLVLVGLLGLAGCGSTGAAGTVRPQIPALPAHLGIACHDPGVTAGQPALVAVARNRQALAECKRRHRDTVAFTRDVRARLMKP
jgi:hypothetical protein